jgi:hypothetical protein
VRRGRPSEEMRTTALLAAAGLGAIETIHVIRGRIRAVYLADAAFEALFVAALWPPARPAANE